jgi:hypothetical protein
MGPPDINMAQVNMAQVERGGYDGLESVEWAWVGGRCGVVLLFRLFRKEVELAQVRAMSSRRASLLSKRARVHGLPPCDWLCAKPRPFTTCLPPPLAPACSPPSHTQNTTCQHTVPLPDTPHMDRFLLRLLLSLLRRRRL